MSDKLYFSGAFWPATGVLVLLAALGIAGQADYEEEVRSAETYCKMVASGSWPDYKKTYANQCDRGLTSEVKP